MADGFKITIESRQAIQFLEGQGEQVKNNVFRIMNLVTRDIRNDARNTLRDEGHIFTGRLINSIVNRVYEVGDNIIGEVYSGTDYDIFVHEGTRKHFVNFRDSGGVERLDLINWAVSHGLIERDGDRFISSETGQPIRGITVGITASKFLEQAYQRHVLYFIEQIQKAGAGNA